MEPDELLALEASAKLYQTIPDYLLEKKKKSSLELALLELIDALDVVEYRRSKESFLQSIQYEIPYHRKRMVLKIVEKYGLTTQEGHVLRYLANGRDVPYIADKLVVSTNTVKTHKYSIYRKLGIHSSQQLEQLLSKKDLV